MAAKRKRTVLESYKHRAAINVLKKWLSDEYEVRTEEEFVIDGWTFYPDISVYKEGFLQAMYEVTHTHPVDARKLGRIQHYCYRKGINIMVHEVDAEWILRQIGKPESIIKFTFET